MGFETNYSTKVQRWNPNLLMPEARRPPNRRVFYYADERQLGAQFRLVGGFEIGGLAFMYALG